MSPFFFAAVAWIGIVLFVQGIYVLRVGVARLFLFQNSAAPRLPVSRRVQRAFVTLFCSVLPLYMVFRILLHIRQSITPGDVVSAAAFCVPGVWFMLQPTVPIRWALRDDPDIPLNTPWALWIARLCGALFLFMGLLVIAPW
jgi:hypothetical protein